MNYPYNNDDFESLNDLNKILERVGESKIVIIGTPNFGSSEFFRWMAQISQRLIVEKDFGFIGIEGDWQDSYMINSYIKGYTNSHLNSIEVLSSIKHWPTWIWANQEMAQLTDWLKEYNYYKSEEDKVGFFGLDIYNQWEAMDRIHRFLKKYAPYYLSNFRKNIEYLLFYPCIASNRRESHNLVPSIYVSESTETLLRNISRSLMREGGNNGEKTNYIKLFLKGDTLFWNTRITTITENLKRIMNYHGKNSKAILFTSSLMAGNSKGTVSSGGESLTIGSLLKEELGDKGVTIIGFENNQGEIVAGKEWGTKERIATIEKTDESLWGGYLNNINSKIEGSKVFFSGEEEGLDKWMESRQFNYITGPESKTKSQFSNYSIKYDIVCYIDKIHPLHLFKSAVKDEIGIETFSFKF